MNLERTMILLRHRLHPQYSSRRRSESGAGLARL